MDEKPRYKHEFIGDKFAGRLGVFDVYINRIYNEIAIVERDDLEGEIHRYMSISGIERDQLEDSDLRRALKIALAWEKAQEEAAVDPSISPHSK